MNRTSSFLLALSIGAASTGAHADAAKDMQAVGKSLGFVTGPGAGAPKLAIVYDPASAPSQAQANELLAAAGSALKAGSKTLEPVLVKASEAASIDATAIFLTTGLGAAASAASDAAKTKKIPCATFDIDQVTKGACAIGIKTEPKLEIMVNRAAVDAAGLKVDDAFKMLVKEI